MKELFLTVKAMRSAQRHYFAETDRIRKQEYLQSSKRLEREVDKMIDGFMIQGETLVKIDQKDMFG